MAEPPKRLQIGPSHTREQLLLLQAQAIQAYAALEHTMCRVFASLGGIELGVASIVFSRIVNSRMRNAIISELFRKKHGTKYAKFRETMLTQLRPIDDERNKIVHWNLVISSRSVKEITTTKISLRPPDFFYRSNRALDINWENITSFIEKCTFYRKVCNAFANIDNGSNYGMEEAERLAWLDIFEQPIVYPPPSAHPIFLKPQAP